METKWKPSAIVLDMDGLMFNTEDIYDRTGEILLGRRGHQFTLELKRLMMGRTAPVAFAKLREYLNLQESIEELQAESAAIWMELLPGQIEKMQGLDWLLDSAEAAGLPLAVATSSPRILAEFALGYFHLINRFRFVLTGDDVINGKPDPEIYLAAADRLEQRAADILVFEDSPIGSQAAVAAGARTVAVPGVHNEGEDYSHVWRVVTRLDDDFVAALLGG